MNESDGALLHEYPDAWDGHISELTDSVDLVVAGYPTHAQLTADELTVVYFPLLHTLQEQQHDARILAGLAGIPGSGKSTFAAMLKHVADYVLGDRYFTVVGMDGWHWPNAVLDQRTIQNEAGDEIPLRQRKGGPESFDVESLEKSLRALQEAKGAVALPVYDRRLHEPVANGMVVPDVARIILVEGNYLLSGCPPWDRISTLLSPRLFLQCDADVARQRTIDRHVRGGMSPEAAADKFEMNDRRNADIIRNDASNADMNITFDPEPRLLRNRGQTR